MTRNSDILNASEAAAFFGAHVETVRRLARRGEVPSFKVGKDWRFSRDALKRWSEEHHARTRPATVLVIDDDEMVLNLICRSLEGVGCRVVTATSGIAGLEKVAGDQPDLVLLDLKMPGMSGPEFLQKLRINHPELPVVIVTGYPDGDLMLQAAVYGPLMLIPKPVDMEQIKRAVRMAAGRELSLQRTR